MNTSSSLDQEVFQELYESVGEQASAVTSLYETFLKSATHLIDTLRSAEVGESRDKTLHALKGSAAMMGATRIAQLATDLQQAPAVLEHDRLKDTLEQLDAELARVREAVDARLAALAT